MNKASFLESVVEGRRVLFIDAIRSDVPSGGNTATTRLKASLRGARTWHQLDLNPDARLGAMARTLAFLLASFPAPLFIYWLRRSHSVWLEFFIRLSPYFFLKCVWSRIRYRPDCVFFNHHATFLYNVVFAGCVKILVWHDVPSFKRDERAETAAKARRCAWIERLLLKGGNYNVTLSFSDRKALRRLHGENAYVVPVISDVGRQRTKTLDQKRLLLIGNWTRIENSEGATAFLQAYSDLMMRRGLEGDQLQFNIAGHGAPDYVESIRKTSPGISMLPISSVGRYGDIVDFDEIALVAPLLRGAGIKLKTIEAWSCGIPVIGTKQAFTGIPISVRKLGGIQCVSPAEIAERCSDPAAFAQEIASLDPRLAYDMYQEAVRRSEDAYALHAA